MKIPYATAKDPAHHNQDLMQSVAREIKYKTTHMAYIWVLHYISIVRCWSQKDDILLK